jgi:hypothetical protein
MAIEDFLPPIFTGTPSMYQGLLTDPKDRIALERRANLGGLLSAGAALAQGMSPQGYRRSALQNVLTALAAGYGGAAQTYESGINQMANVMKLQQSKRQLEGLQKLAEANPDLAYLASVSPDEFVKQVSARQRMKMYGLGTPTSQAAPAPVPAPVSAPAPAPTVEAPAGLMSPEVGSGGFVGGGYGSADMAAPPVVRGVFAQTAPPPVVTTRAATVTPAAPVAPVAPSAVAPKPKSFVSPEDQAAAARLRNLAVIAKQAGDVGVADEFTRQAEELDPKEQYFLRDNKLISNKRGELADFGGKRVLTDAEALAINLDPKLGKWQIIDNIPSLIPNTGVSVERQREELIAGLPQQFKGVYPTLQTRVNSLIDRASKLTKDQINSEIQNILAEDEKIKQTLDPTLIAAALKKAREGRPQNIINLTDPAKRAQALSENSSRYVQNKNVSESFEVATRFNNFVQAYNNPAAGGASDAVLIYSMAKMLDPGGAVQQGDIGTIAGQKSIPDKLKSIHQQFINSRILSDDQRQDLNAMAYSLMQNKKKSVEPVIKQYRNYAVALESPDPEVDVQDPFSTIQLPKNRIVTINGKRTQIRLGNDNNYYYTDPKGKNYLYKD